MGNPVDLMDTNISITVNLSGIPAQAAGFGTVMLAALPGVGVWPAVVRTYSYATATAAIAADLAATLITSATATKLATAFSQNPHPATIKVGKIAVATIAADLASRLDDLEDRAVVEGDLATLAL